MSDKRLRQDVLDELEFEPSLDAKNIGVAVDSGVATLTGHVASYAEKIAAENATRRVRGVRAIAQEIHVQSDGESRFSDDALAKRAADILSWNIQVPSDAIMITVQHGWATLTGAVDWQFQKQAAEDDIRRLSGVQGVHNEIKINPQLQVADIQGRIEDALKRHAAVEAKGIRVTAVDGKVTLEGTVHSWDERFAAESAAWSAAGVHAVEDRLAIS
ncbi:MAG: BON domain-containing protein [Hyphomicrobiales bacterium]